MAKWADYKTIKSAVTMEMVLGHYGLSDRLKRKGDNLVGACPIHKGTNESQFHVSTTKNNFNCFGDCHGGGNVLDFVSKLEGVDVRKAALMIQEWFGIEARRPPQKPAEAPAAAEVVVPADKDAPAKDEQAVKVNPPLKFSLKHLNQDHPYLKERGLENKTIEEFGAGLCTKGIMAGRVAIPIHNEKGDVVAYIGRWPGEPPEGEPKYKLPAGFHKSLVVFNLHRAKILAETQGLVLVEGLFDCMKVWQAGFKNVVALMGSSLSEEQERLILGAVGPLGRVSLMFDEDEAGWACRKDALGRLALLAHVRVVELNGNKLQPDSLSEEEIRSRLGRPE